MSTGVTIQHPTLPIPDGLGLLRGRGEEEGQSQQSGGKQLLDTAGEKQLPNCASLLEKGHGREVTRCWHQQRNTWQGQGSQGGEAGSPPSSYSLWEPSLACGCSLSCQSCSPSSQDLTLLFSNANGGWRRKLHSPGNVASQSPCSKGCSHLGWFLPPPTGR